MALTTKQQGVAKGMAAGGLTAILIIGLGAATNPFGFPAELPMDDKIAVAVRSAAAPGLILAVAIARLAKHRFFTPEDIDAGAAQTSSSKAQMLQSMLQNTLEQAVLAVIAYGFWAVTMPSAWLSVCYLAAAAFVIARILFFVGYERGAPARSFGFALTFYPSLLILIIAIAASGLR